MNSKGYARVGEDEVAFELSGQGSVDLLHIPGLLNHLESKAEDPALARHYSELASFSRLIMYDKRGTGLSGRLRADRPLTIEERAEEALAVLDAVGSRSVAVHATADGVPVALFLAASHPERVSALSLYAASARLSAAPDYPIGLDRDGFEAVLRGELPRWGDEDDPAAAAILVPSRLGDPAVMRSLARMERMAGTPTAVERFFELVIDTDVRDVLGAVQVPTLVTHCRDDLLIPVAHGRYVASNLADGRFVELEGTDHYYFWDTADAVIDELRRFLTGTSGSSDRHRVLATVLFTDIVGSTDRAVSQGDARWRDLLDRHDAMVKACIDRYTGERIKTTGDGVLAVFDAPTRAVQCALAIRDDALALGLQIRAGVHTGELERRNDDVAGIAVHAAARVMAKAGDSEVMVSRTVADITAGSDLTLTDAGEYDLKGLPGRWQLFVASHAT